MKGVVFIGGNGPEPSVSGKAAEGARLIVAADAGLIAAEEAGLRPDWIVGDMDSLYARGAASRLGGYRSDRILRYPPDKDDTDTELSLNLLWDKGCDEVLVIGGGGGRIDHIFALRALFERDPCPARWLTDREEIFCLKEGAFSCKVHGLVSAFPVGEGPWRAKSEGLKWPLDRVVWRRGFFGVSNVADGLFAVSVTQGKFLLIVNR
ncbi:MAG: thiamine diphosphokinase [Treponema sp.]|jgi:thiamine pyrophosphokinase|nr:thiamine diphosphokinase [Treponema sp.]